MVKKIWQQVKFEFVSAARNSEQQLISIVLPVGVLLLGRFSNLGESILALAIGLTVLGSNLAGPAIGLAFDRRYGSIKGWAFTTIGVRGFLAGRLGALFFQTVIQTLVLLAVSFALFNEFSASWLAILGYPLLIIGTAGIAVTIASTLRAEAVLASANLSLVLLSATAWLAVDSIWSWLNPLSMWLQVWQGDAIYLLGLFVYAVVFQVTAARTFKWD
jgi:ABC-2 type transport system permease protein